MLIYFSISVHLLSFLDLYRVLKGNRFKYPCLLAINISYVKQHLQEINYKKV